VRPAFHVDEVCDFDVPRRVWAAPGRPPLFVIRNLDPSDSWRVLEALERPLPLGARPMPGDRWLDIGAGYGAFAALAHRLGAAFIQPIEHDAGLAELLERAAFLNELEDRVAATIVEPVTRHRVLGLLEREEINALRFADGLTLDPFDLPPRVAKVVAIVPRRRARLELDRLRAVFSEVAGASALPPAAVGFSAGAWDRVPIYAWGARIA
jgi:hypothetical protein